MMVSRTLKESLFEVTVMKGAVGKLSKNYLVVAKLRIKMEVSGRIGHMQRRAFIIEVRKGMKIGEINGVVSYSLLR